MKTMKMNTSASLKQRQEISIVSSSLLTKFSFRNRSKDQKKDQRQRRNKATSDDELMLWNRVATLRQDVATMQEDLNHLNAIITNHIHHPNHHPSLSDKQPDPYASSASVHDDDDDDDSSHSEDTNDSESILNLRGILVAVSSSFSSGENDDSDTASASTMSSLGLGGHEATASLENAALSKSLGTGIIRSPPKSNTLSRMDKHYYHPNPMEEDHDSFSSLSTWDEPKQKGKLLAFIAWDIVRRLFLNWLPSIFWVKQHRLTRRRNQRLLLLVVCTAAALLCFLPGSVLWNNHQDWFPPYKTSQSCVTTRFHSNHSTLLLSTQQQQTDVETTFAQTPSSGIQLLPLPYDPEEYGANITAMFLRDEPMELDSISIMDSPRIKSKKKMRKLIESIQHRGQRFVQKLTNNNKDMWSGYRDPTPTASWLLDRSSPIVRNKKKNILQKASTMWSGHSSMNANARFLSVAVAN
jgi:hypothetical protein